MVVLGVIVLLFGITICKQRNLEKLRAWRNWQTHYLEVVAEKSMQVQILSPALYGVVAQLEAGVSLRTRMLQVRLLSVSPIYENLAIKM